MIDRVAAAQGALSISPTLLLFEEQNQDGVSCRIAPEKLVTGSLECSGRYKYPLLAFLILLTEF